MPREINLDGVEVSILKALGTGGGDTAGETLLSRLEGLEFAEVLDSIEGMISIGYVSSDRVAIRKREEFEKAAFYVNSGYARDLKNALEPVTREKPRSRRIRRE
ncbi:MAG: hypothetical protein JWL90_3797 [Chthoniobacteraceae bacterium]|nr:hypothetical protein [Chthoniobacteraceae bacterium]MDB6171841.1 hypothetical protein [Chthoniobacteraceae bacterium]